MPRPISYAINVTRILPLGGIDRQLRLKADRHLATSCIRAFRPVTQQNLNFRFGSGTDGLPQIARAAGVGVELPYNQGLIRSLRSRYVMVRNRDFRHVNQATRLVDPYDNAPSVLNCAARMLDHVTGYS